MSGTLTGLGDGRRRRRVRDGRVAAGHRRRGALRHGAPLREGGVTVGVQLLQPPPEEPLLAAQLLLVQRVLALLIL